MMYAVMMYQTLMNFLQELLTYWAIFLMHPGAITLRRTSKALGDNLMLSCLAREIKRNDPSRYVMVETSWPELFEHNPNVDTVFSKKVALRYYKNTYTITPTIHEHTLDQMIRHLPVSISHWERQVDLYYPEEQFAHVLNGLPDRYLVVNPAGKQTYSANRKEWGVDNFQALRSRLKHLPFVQIGSADTPLLPQTIDKRGRPILEDAHLIKHSLTGIFLEGGLMHLANGLNKPSVIIYGGCLHPNISGYAMHYNIFTTPACSPCYTSQVPLSPCDTMQCMKIISVDQVIQGIYSIIH